MRHFISAHLEVTLLCFNATNAKLDDVRVEVRPSTIDPSRRRDGVPRETVRASPRRVNARRARRGRIGLVATTCRARMSALSAADFNERRARASSSCRRVGVMSRRPRPMAAAAAAGSAAHGTATAPRVPPRATAATATTMSARMRRRRCCCTVTTTSCSRRHHMMAVTYRRRPILI